MQVTIEIPDDIARQLPAAPAEREARLLLELAVALYAKGTLSLAQGAEMAGMSRMDFGGEVGERGIPRHCGAEELEEDLAYAEDPIRSARGMFAGSGLTDALLADRAKERARG